MEISVGSVFNNSFHGANRPNLLDRFDVHLLTPHTGSKDAEEHKKVDKHSLVRSPLKECARIGPTPRFQCLVGAFAGTGGGPPFDIVIGHADGLPFGDGNAQQVREDQKFEWSESTTKKIRAFFQRAAPST